MSVTLYVEGGGHRQLDADLRRAFQTFLTTAGVKQRPKIIASGSRQSAYNDFRHAHARGESVWLLVDAEAAVAAVNAAGEDAQWRPWAHLKQRDDWDRPAGAVDQQCHLMVECMENWFLADPKMLADYFGKGFKASSLPKAGTSVEALGKAKAQQGLKAATRHCATQGTYDKGAHSFKLLAHLDPDKLLPLAPWAKRLVEALR